MSLAKIQISVNPAPRNVDLAIGMKRAVFVMVPSEEQAAVDVDVGSENICGVAAVQIEARNLGRLEPNLLRERASDHHDSERHVHIREVERAYNPRAKHADTARMNARARRVIDREPLD